jgi:hypothetical protein
VTDDLLRHCDTTQRRIDDRRLAFVVNPACDGGHATSSLLETSSVEG